MSNRMKIKFQVTCTECGHTSAPMSVDAGSVARVIQRWLDTCICRYPQR